MNKITNKINEIRRLDIKLIMPFCIALLFLLSGVKGDFDSFFIIENGKQIVTNLSFPHEDWMSMHEGLHIVLQQWLFSVLVYIVYENFGWHGLYLMMSLFCFLLYFLIFKICLKRSKNDWLISIVLTVISINMINHISATIRPTILSLIMLSLTILVLEYSKDKKLLLYLLPLISLVDSNTHSTFWIAIIGTIFVFALFDRRRDLIISLILSIGAGFINPYGYEALFQVFYTIGYDGYSYITELQPLSGLLLVVMLTVPMIFFSYNIVKKGVSKDQAPYLILFIITLLATLFACRSLSFFALLFSAYISGYYNNKSVETIEIKEGERNYSFILASIVIVAAMFCTSINMGKIDPSHLESTDFNSKISNMLYGSFRTLDDSELVGKTVASDDIQVCQVLYHEFGMKGYLDGRLETYIDSMNKKEDIFGEYMKVIRGFYHFNEFTDKYKFDYLVLSKSATSVYTYADMSDKYERIYETEGKNGFNVYKRIFY